MTQVAPGTEPEIKIEDLAKSLATLTQVVSQLAEAPPVKARSTKRGRGKSKGKGKGRPQSTPELKAERMAANDAECINVFSAAGYKDVKPRENVLTYDKWIAAGRKVRAKEKSHRVGMFNLFHVDQTDPLLVA